MSHNHLEAHGSDIKIDSSEEELETVVELADAIRELTDKFDQVQQALDSYEMTLLRPDSDLLQSHQHLPADTIHRWQKFIEHVTKELDALPPVP